MQKLIELNGGKPLKPSQVVTGVVSDRLMKMLFHPHSVVTIWSPWFTVANMAGYQLNLEPVR